MSCKTPAEIAECAVNAAVNKSRLPLSVMSVMGFLAGAYIAMGGYFMTIVTQDASAFVGVGLSKLAGGIVFALGLLLVVGAGGELFTGNCLMPIGVLSNRCSWSGLLRNWSVVYLTNMAGGLFFALLIYKSGGISDKAAETALNIAAAKVSIPIAQMIVRGILCNWFVGLAVWLAFGATDMAGKYIACLVPISAFVAMGFEHCIANMYFIGLGIMLKGDTALIERLSYPADKLAGINLCGYLNNLIPVTLGNILGAALLVACLYFVAFRKSLTDGAKIS
ncbi:MAG: formate/nitrite transporter family protein [Cloacibacillus sp.]